MLPNIAVCTIAMWVLNAIAVIPLTNWLFRTSLLKAGGLAVEGAGGTMATKDLIDQHQGLYTTKYIQADLIVMGIAGFIAGLAGLQMIGFAWKAKAWPGLLAMIAASFMGYALSR